MPADTDMSDASSVASDENRPKYFKVAIDFGTTCSSVAYLDTQDRPEPHPDRLVGADEPRLVTGFPDSARNNIDVQDQKRESVPSQCWYGPKAPTKTMRKRKASDLNDSSEDHDKELEEYLSIESKTTYQWGYGVQAHVNNHDTERKTGVYFHNMKLFLDDSENTKKLRIDLKASIDKFQKLRGSKNNMEPIIEYLSHLLRHSRQHLDREAGFNDNCTVEFIICVPAAWNAVATMSMQRAVELAIRRSKFLKEDHPSMRNLFVISEPEAASMCVLDSGRGSIREKDTFIVLDAGGGTVDAACYTVACKTPLRLQREETLAEGVACGSSFLNLGLKELLENRLNVSDFEPADVDLRQIIETAVFEFEYGLKRRIDVYSDEGHVIFLPGLKADRSRNFLPKRLFLNSYVLADSDGHVHAINAQVDRSELRKLFEPCLTGTSDLLFRQIEAARAKSLLPKKVVMIGGFAESPSLQTHIDRELKKYNSMNGTKIRRISTRTPSTAVAQGAILRSLNKEDCPARIVQFSYGFKTDEEYGAENENEEIRQAHASDGVKITRDSVDGASTVKDTILWIIQQGQCLESKFAYRYPNRWVFGSRESRFVCKIEVFTSDKKQESHYQKGHEKNKGAQRVVSVSADMTFLRYKKLIQPIRPPNATANDRRKVWPVELDLVIRIHGRSLRFEAYWPQLSPTAGELLGEHPGELRQSCELSLAGAFTHGTA